MGPVREKEFAFDELKRAVAQSGAGNAYLGHSPEVWLDEFLVGEQQGLHVLILQLKVVRLQEKTLVPEERFMGIQWYALS